MKKSMCLLFVPLLALAACDRPNPMLGRWLFRHAMYRCYTIVEVKPDGKLIETVKLSTLEPKVMEYKFDIVGQGVMEMRSASFVPNPRRPGTQVQIFRKVKYSVIGDTMRIKEPGSANDGFFVRMKPSQKVPWEDMSEPRNRPGATAADRMRLEGRAGGQQPAGGQAAPPASTPAPSGGQPPAGGQAPGGGGQAPGGGARRR